MSVSVIPIPTGQILAGSVVNVDIGVVDPQTPVRLAKQVAGGFEFAAPGVDPYVALVSGPPDGELQVVLKAGSSNMAYGPNAVLLVG